MPTLSHEALVALFRERPSLAAEVLPGILGVTVPRYRDARVEDASFAVVAPAEYRADVVVVLRGSQGQPVLGIVVEVQLRASARKRRSWPLYAAALHARLGCQVCLLVIAPDPRVAAWARRPVETVQPGSPFTPVVLGPEATPFVADPARARAAPELAVLSAVAHGREPRALPVALAALDAVARLDPDRAALYHDLIFEALGAAARAALEKAMDLSKYELKTEFAKKHIAIGLAKGKAEGLREGKAEGRAEGKAEGKAEGRAEGKAEALLAFLKARGLAVSAAQRARILSCHDIPALDRWIVVAAAATSTSQILRPAPRAHRTKRAARR